MSVAASFIFSWVDLVESGVIPSFASVAYMQWSVVHYYQLKGPYNWMEFDHVLVEKSLRPASAMIAGGLKVLGFGF